MSPPTSGSPGQPRWTPGPTGSADVSLRRLWDQLHHPVDPQRAIEALVGVPQRTAKQVVGGSVAGGAEARALLAAMPELVRNLSISTVSVPERCIGQIRGPVMWSETMSARASSAGDPGVFVCATVARAYDTPENRLLVTALTALVRGGRDVERFRMGDGEEPALLVDARQNADAAMRFLDHRALINVRPEPLRRRSIHRVRRDRRRRGYEAVADMLDRAANPLDVETLRLFCTDMTTARHDLLVASLDHLSARGIHVPKLFIAGHEVVGGPIRFHHPALSARGGRASVGLWVGTTRLEVPGGLAPTDGTVIVHNREQMVSAIDEAIVRDRI